MSGVVGMSATAGRDGPRVTLTVNGVALLGTVVGAMAEVERAWVRWDGEARTREIYLSLPALVALGLVAVAAWDRIGELNGQLTRLSEPETGRGSRTSSPQGEE